MHGADSLTVEAGPRQDPLAARRPDGPADAGATLADWLAAAPFTLAMSSGFFGFFAHAGALAALVEAGLRPAAVRGSSAGALVTGIWAAGLPPPAIQAELLALTRADFWDPAPGLGFLRGRLFDARLRRLLPVPTIERCPVPAAISVFDVLSGRTEVLTAGDLARAIRASCALPGLFQPVWIGGRPKLDGGIADRPGLAGAAPGERVLYHHLIPRSFWRRQAGPHAAPPCRPQLKSLVIPAVPRVTPFTLTAGREAYRIAREATSAALAAPA